MTSEVKIYFFSGKENQKIHMNQNGEELIDISFSKLIVNDINNN